MHLPCRYLWQAKDGSFHLLVHGDCGYHAFSEDGLHWLTSPNGSKTCAFPRVNVPHEDGGAVSFARRERPHLLFGDDGVTPQMLFTSLTNWSVGHKPPNDKAFTFAQAIKQ